MEKKEVTLLELKSRDLKRKAIIQCLAVLSEQKYTDKEMDWLVEEAIVVVEKYLQKQIRELND